MERQQELRQAGQPQLRESPQPELRGVFGSRAAQDIADVIRTRTRLPADTTGQKGALDTVLAMMQATSLAQLELSTTMEYLARQAALLGATDEQRGSAVGLTRQGAAKKWGSAPDARAEHAAAVASGRPVSPAAPATLVASVPVVAATPVAPVEATPVAPVPAAPAVTATQVAPRQATPVADATQVAEGEATKVAPGTVQKYRGKFS